jgi:L-alanine-DL-glutamate epimerase-like enolase superfamily enzyme
MIMTENRLQIDRIDLYKLLIPLKEPFIISLGAEYNAESVIVVIKTREGITGFGECSPYAAINGEVVDTCMVTGQMLGKILKPENPLDIKKCLQLMDSVIYGNTSIKSAFDMALLDIGSQHAGLPLYKYLRRLRRAMLKKEDAKKWGVPDDHATNKELYTDYTISLGETDKMADDAKRFAAMGFPVIKIKVGGEPQKDIERVKAVRKAVGSNIALRIDANQGWKVKGAVEVLNGVKDCDIQFCEEPIARWNFMKLRKVRKNSPIPIMADETCGDVHDAERLIALGACDMFNIKLGKCGGLYNALKIINAAAANAMPLQIGGFTESRLGITAEVHLAHTGDNILYYDFDTPLMFTEDPVRGGAEYGQNGLVTVTETPGLSASIDAARLEKMESVSVY